MVAYENARMIWFNMICQLCSVTCNIVYNKMPHYVIEKACVVNYALCKKPIHEMVDG